MILLDTDTVTLLNHGHPRVAARALAATELVAITVVSRIEILRGRWDFLLKAADGEQLQRAQQLLRETEQALNTFVVAPIDAAAAAEFDRLRGDRKVKKIGRADLLIAASRWRIGPRSSPATCGTSARCRACNWTTGPTE
jgi:tRNA(fMet)-specific endonuclease VapC